MSLFMMPGLPEMMVLLAVVILMFGGKKIPSLMRGLGKGIAEFKQAKSEIKTAIKEGQEDVENMVLELKDPGSGTQEVS